ncbi:114aa long hypothetical protein [Pyrococcus horikoshii OT3]|uniref:Uncharacterized protein n=1 Tax=Pyrococcus horikoshii (strain ATCC 700860 / DSM 12428 / JCM 9974 / NBRC 100139 / OT-3) TaxID=70601 RepID=O59363_PYRHO|nr:114aa long hypothetical protein [Pyrococcus horikoshii OT3]
MNVSSINFSAFFSAPAVPSFIFSPLEYLISTPNLSPLPKYSIIFSFRYPTRTIISSTPIPIRFINIYSIRGLLKKGIIGFGLYTVRGNNLVPFPPANNTACIVTPRVFITFIRY